MRISPRQAALLAILLTFLSLPSPSAAQRRRTAPVRITFLADGSYSAMLGLRDQIQESIESLLGDRFQLDFSRERDRVGDYTIATARQLLNSALTSNDTDLLIALGALSGVAVGERASLPIPVLVPYTLEPEMAGLPLVDGHSGRRNLAYIADGVDVRNALRRFHDVHRYRRVHVLLSEATERAAPGLADNIRGMSETVGSEVKVLLTTSARAEGILAGLPDDVEALFLSPLVRMEDGEVSELLRLAYDRRLPIFAFGGRRVCELGALGSITSEEDLLRRARRTATFVERWLDGEDLATFDVSFAPTELLYLNLRTAQQTGARPNWILLTEAELVDAEVAQSGRALTLNKALLEVVRRNADLSAAEAEVDSAGQDVDRARAALLPQASLSATGVLVDEDRANNIGSAGQLSANWQASVSQLAYSPKAWGGFEIQQHTRNATAASRDATRLDVILQGGEAYLNVLRALAAFRIQQQNLRLTRTNLRRARMRVRIGRSSEAEVIRWESSLAGDQRQVLEAFAQIRAAQLELNRTLNRPLSEPFRLAEANQPPEDMLVSVREGEEESLRPYLNDPWSFAVLTDFLAAEGLENSPELKQVDAAVKAQRRRLQMSEQVLFLPNLSLSASLTNNFFDEGGGNPRNVPANLVDFIAPLDPFDFQVVLQATLPIYSGGERYADLRQSRVEIRRLGHQRRSIELLVEQGVRAAMASIAPAYANIELSRRAADAALRNLELVNASYLAGTVDIIRVLDAQSQAVNASLAAANAVYDLILLILRAERRAGRFRYFAGPEERRDLMDRLTDFARRHRRTQSPEIPRREAP